MRNYKKKIILFITGGSGNQLIQISHFKNIIEKENYDFKICHILCKKNLLNKITNFKIHENFLNLNLVYVDMPKHLFGKYQYYTKAEMTRNTLPEQLIPKKENVLSALGKYSLEIYENYLLNFI